LVGLLFSRIECGGKKNYFIFTFILILIYRSSLQIDQDLSPKEKDNFFITNGAYYSAEINIHCLTSIIILVSKGYLPSYALNTYLFSSQPCEATFRTARALTGTLSSITNFSAYQFMNKIEKISILNHIKSTGVCKVREHREHRSMRDSLDFHIPVERAQ
jgi:hypothetical protein